MRLTPDMVSTINAIEVELAKLEDYRTALDVYHTKVVNATEKIDRLKTVYAALERGEVPVTRLTRQC